MRQIWLLPLHGACTGKVCPLGMASNSVVETYISPKLVLRVKGDTLPENQRNIFKFLLMS